MPGWKDRAVPADSGWKSRATPVGPVNPVENPYTELESAGMGAIQGVTFGFADEIYGAGKGAYDSLTSDKKLMESYLESRDAARKQFKEADQDNPVSYTGGSIGGAAVPAFFTGGLSTIPGAIAGGAATAAGLTESNPLNSPAELEDFAKDVVIGGATGGVAKYGLDKAGSALAKAPAALRRTAEQRAVKAAVGSDKKAIKDLVKSGRLQSTGRELLSADEAGGPVVGWLSKTEDIGPRVLEKQKYYGKKIGEVSDAIDEAMPGSVSGDKIAGDILEEASKIPDMPHKKPIIDEMMKTAEYFQGKGNISFKEAQAAKNQFGFTVKDRNQLIDRQDAHNKMYSAVGKNMDSTAEAMSEIADDEVKRLAGQYGSYKDKYGVYKPVKESFENRQAANLANRFVSPSDYGAGAATALGSLMVGANPVLGVAGAGLNKVARERGSAFAARGLDSIANILESSPQVLGKYAGVLEDAYRRGGTSLGVTHGLLMQRDPEYKQLIESMK